MTARFVLDRHDIGLRYTRRTGVIEMAHLNGDDTEWHPVALTEFERIELAIALLKGTDVVASRPLKTARQIAVDWQRPNERKA